MRKPKEEYKKISVQITLKQAKKLEEISKLRKQSISAYIRDNIFSTNPNFAKEEFYNNILQDVHCIKDELEEIDLERLRKIENQLSILLKYQNIILTLLRIIGSEPRKTPKDMSDIINKLIENAKQKNN